MSFWDKLAAIEIPNSLSFAVTVISTLVAVVASVYAFAVIHSTQGRGNCGLHGRIFSAAAYQD